MSGSPHLKNNVVQIASPLVLRRVVGNVDLVEVVQVLAAGLITTYCLLRVPVHLVTAPSVQD